MKEKGKDWQDIVQCIRFSPDEIERISQDFCTHVEEALQGNESSLCALNTYASLPTGREKGTFLVLDVGGTNVRAGRITLFGNGLYSIESMVKRPLRSHDYDYTTKDTTKEAFFDFVASVIKDAAGSVKECNLGVTFSFAVDQLSLSDAILLSWSKEIAVPGIVGTSVMGHVKDALCRCGLPKIYPMAIVNDTTATLLSSVYEGQRSHIGIVCGTGFNMCYEEPSLGMIVNLEAAGFTNVPKTPWDVCVDRASNIEGNHVMEKMISGQYISQVYRYALEEWLQRPIPSMTTEAMNGFVEGNGVVGTILVDVLGNEDVEGAQQIGKALFSRAAQLLGAASFGVLRHLYGRGRIPAQTLSIEGSLISHISGMKEEMAATIDGLCHVKKEGAPISVTINDGGPSLGAAVAASLIK